MNTIEIQEVMKLFGITGVPTAIGDYIKINTGKEIKCIKKANYKIDRLWFIHELKEYLYSSGFKNIDRFILAEDAQPYISFNNQVYILTNWIDFKKCDFSQIDDIKLAIQTMAKFHNAALGFNPSEKAKAKIELGKLPEVLEKRTQEVIKLKKIAQNSRGKIDFLFTQNINFFIDKCINSCINLKESSYSKIVEQAVETKPICHHDYSYHNLIFDSNHELHIINFDYCCYDIHVYDITSFLRKVMSECKWDVNIAVLAIQWYDEIKKLHQEELEVILAIIEFPQKFWRLANRYYNSKRSKPETGYYNKLLQVVQEKEKFEQFTSQFRNYFIKS